MLRKIVLAACLAALVTVPTAGAVPGADQQVKLTVTPQGFVPAEVTVKAGRPVTLLITRRTDRTCATEFVLEPYKIRAKLPLNRTVAVRFTPTKAGALDYTCSMGMIHGRIVVK